jgi:ABC-2 type transport system ATP-binding protein
MPFAANRKIRAVIASPLAVAAVGLGAVVTWGHPAVAAACPNANAPVATAGASGAPAYTYIRGCIASFDSTPIVYNLFLPTTATAKHPAYTILVGHGWGGQGSQTPDAKMMKAGYAELTWDARGFGQSGGVAEVDDPLSEGRDVSALIDDVLATRHDIAIDTNRKDPTFGQPAVGMFGASYGGGIQLSTAAYDQRVKAIVPQWAWNDLRFSLFPGGTVKLGWGELLFGAGLEGIAANHATMSGTAGFQTGGYDPNIYRSEAQGIAQGFPDQQTLEWFAQRSMVSWGAAPGGHVPHIPTLLVQGTVDTLFNLSEAQANLAMIRKSAPGVPVKLIGFCGGHVSCPTGNGFSDTPKTGFQKGVNDSAFVESAALHWFDVYLRHSAGAKDTLPPVLAQDQAGTWHSMPVFPTAANPGPGTSYLKRAFSGTIASTGAPTAVGPNTGSYTAAVVDGPSQANDPTVLTVPVLTTPSSHGAFIAGEGHVELDATVDGPSSDLFFKLVDVNSGQVLDLQTSAVRIDNTDLPNNGNNPNVSLEKKHISLDLVGVSWQLPAGDTLELQVATSATPFVPNRGAAIVQLAGSVSVPVVG